MENNSLEQLIQLKFSLEKEINVLQENYEKLEFRKQLSNNTDKIIITQYDTNIKGKEGGELNKNTVEHFSKIQQLESELNNNKFETYKEMENTYKQLVQLKQKQLKKESDSCILKQMMKKIKDNNCKKDCLRQLQTDSTNNKIQCGCKSMPKPFNYKNC